MFKVIEKKIYAPLRVHQKNIDTIPKRPTVTTTYTRYGGILARLLTLSKNGNKNLPLPHAHHRHPTGTIMPFRKWDELMQALNLTLKVVE